MAAISKKEADAWDRVLDAAEALTNLIESCDCDIDEYDLEELTIFLAINGAAVRRILKHIKRTWTLD